MAEWDLSEIQRQLLQLDPETRRALELQSQDAAAAMMAASGQEQKFQERGPEIRSEASPAARRQQARRERDVYWEENPLEPLNLETNAPPPREYAPGSGAVVGGFGNRPEGIFDVRGLNPFNDTKTLDLGMEPWVPAMEVGMLGLMGKQGVQSGVSQGRQAFGKSMDYTRARLPRLGSPLATARHEAIMGRARFPQLERASREPRESLWDAQTAMSKEAASGPVDIYKGVAPARVPQGGLETRGARSVGPDPAWRNRANWEHSAREARLSDTLGDAERADASGLMARGHDPKSAWREAQMATERKFSQTPLPRPAPGTRIKSTGPGVRRRTPAEPEPTMTEAARRGASESAENVTKPWTEYPGKLTGTNVEQDVLDIMMTPRHKGGEAWTYSPYRISQLIEGNTGVRVGEGRIRATLKDLEARGLVEPGAIGKDLSAMDAKIRSTIANPDLPLTGARYKKSLPDWANPAAGRERVHLGTYRLRQRPGARYDPPEYFGSE